MYPRLAQGKKGFFITLNQCATDIINQATFILASNLFEFNGGGGGGLHGAFPFLCVRVRVRGGGGGGGLHGVYPFLSFLPEPANH